MPRLFTALPIPPDVTADLALLRGGLPGARWIEPESYHLTLRFIGDIDEDTADDVRAVFGQVRRQPLQVTLTGLAAFGGSKPRAVVATAKPEAALVALQAEHESLMRRIGLAPETRKFVPHVTLARLRHVSPFAVADHLALQGLPPRPFSADRFILYSARDSVGGGPYVPEAVYPLQSTR